MDDAHVLLKRYCAEHSEEAFRQLVARYVNLVYSAALRRLQGHPALAEEVVQSTFAALAAQAWQLSEKIIVSGWLYRTALHHAADLARGEQRRRQREQTFHATMNVTPATTPDPAWEELAPILDSEMGRLPEPDRQALLLRFFEQKDLRSVGQALGISEDAAQKRVGRALGRLREFLGRRGITSKAAALALLLSTHAAAQVPRASVSVIASTALASAACGAARWIFGLSPLAWRWLAGAGLAASVALSTALVVQKRSRSENPPSAKLAENAPLAPKTEKSPNTAPEAEKRPSAADPLLIEDALQAAAKVLHGGSLGITDTLEALQHLQRIAEPQIPQALSKVAQIQDAGAQALLYRYLLARWAEQHPVEALQYAQSRLPAFCTFSSTEGIFQSWAERNPERSMAWIQKTGGADITCLGQVNIASSLFRMLASQSLEKAFGMLEGDHSTIYRSNALRGICETLHSTADREKLLTLAEKGLSPELRLQTQRTVIGRWAETEPEAAAAWCLAVPEERQRRQLIDSLCLSWLQTHPSAAAAWWMAQDPGPDTRVKIVNIWAPLDHEAAGTWLRQQPIGPESDLARMTFARHVEPLDPPAALAWADTISEGKLREDTRQHILSAWQRSDAEAAQLFLSIQNQ